MVNDSLRIGRVKIKADLDETEFISIKMNEMADETYIYYLDCKTNSDVSTPVKLPCNKWDIWEEKVRNGLKTKIGVTNPPISYVIHKDNTPPKMYHSELIIYNASLTTSVLKVDSRKVANILTPLVLDTDAFEGCGIKFTYREGREGWLYLVSH